jgi:hypothetical protein
MNIVCGERKRSAGASRLTGESQFVLGDIVSGRGGIVVGGGLLGPIGGAGGEGGARDHFQGAGLDGLRDRIWGGHDGDLELLIPELGLLGFDLVMELVGLVVELDVLLAELQD